MRIKRLPTFSRAFGILPKTASWAQGDSEDLGILGDLFGGSPSAGAFFGGIFWRVGLGRSFAGDVEFEFCVDIWMETDFHGEVARLFDGALQDNAMAVNFLTGLGLHFFGNVFGGDRSEGFAAFAGFENERKLQFAEAAPEFFRFVQFARFAFGAAGFKGVGHAQSGRSDLVGHTARDEEVAGMAATNFHHIGFGTKAGEVGGQDDFSMRHGRKKQNSPLDCLVEAGVSIFLR